MMTKGSGGKSCFVSLFALGTQRWEFKESSVFPPHMAQKTILSTSLSSCHSGEFRIHSSIFDPRKGLVQRFADKTFFPRSE